MPEGPEIWILSEAINKFYHTAKTVSYGKHLFIFNTNDENLECEDWSFGLTGKVCISDNNELIKLETGWLFGDKIIFQKCDYGSQIQKLGIDWMTSPPKYLENEINKWCKTSRKLGGLLLDQSKISGIGVAWGSEILHRAGLRPDIRVCDQDLSQLVNVMVDVREKIKQKYSEHVDELTCKEFINNWFDNLYEIREMQVYKKGTKIVMLGRSWWV